MADTSLQDQSDSDTPDSSDSTIAALIAALQNSQPVKQPTPRAAPSPFQAMGQQPPQTPAPQQQPQQSPYQPTQPSGYDSGAPTQDPQAGGGQSYFMKPTTPDQVASNNASRGAFYASAANAPPGQNANASPQIATSPLKEFWDSLTGTDEQKWKAVEIAGKAGILKKKDPVEDALKMSEIRRNDSIAGGVGGKGQGGFQGMRYNDLMKTINPDTGNLYTMQEAMKFLDQYKAGGTEQQIEDNKKAAATGTTEGKNLAAGREQMALIEPSIKGMKKNVMDVQNIFKDIMKEYPAANFGTKTLGVMKTLGTWTPQNRDMVDKLTAARNEMANTTLPALQVYFKGAGLGRILQAEVTMLTSALSFDPETTPLSSMVVQMGKAGEALDALKSKYEVTQQVREGDVTAEEAGADSSSANVPKVVNWSDQ
jgi:hypothetical protein